MTLVEDRSTGRHRKTRRPARRTAASRLGSFFESLLLTILSIGGIICIIAVICALVFNITLIMFRTGSMAPTIPPGSLAIVQEKSPAEVRVGDVTTIDRGEGELPVTHRITAIESLGGGLYSIRMKGDANDSEDPAPYEVTKVRKVLWSIPKLGFVVAKIQNPKVMAVTTVIMAIFVTWAFWPRRRKS